MKIIESTLRAKPVASEGGHETGMMVIGSKNREKTSIDGI